MSAIQKESSPLQYLVQDSVLTAQELDRLQRLYSREAPNLSFPEFVVGMGTASEESVFAAVARHFDLPLVDRQSYEIVPGLDGRISEEFLKSHRAIPCAEKNDHLLVAVSNPENEFIAKSIAMATGRTVETVVGLPSDIDAAIEKFFGDERTQVAKIADAIDVDYEPAGGVEAEKLRDMASEAPVVKLVNLMFNRAQAIGASDIHLEPFEDELKLRYRVDGVLTAAEAPPPSLGAAVVSRLKLMARLNIAERRLPQDGKIRLQQNGREFDVRVSTVPTVHGESIVMRMLDRGDIKLSLESLGFDESAANLIRKTLAQPHGMLLVTGPTGSGKTTTLYAALQLLNTPERKVITIEDPVEYQLDGVNQIQVQPAIDLTFANALRAIVRQDPDVMMVGEMRDVETASICIQSALTGHLVLSTVHTNDAAGAITRLLDMGVESYLLPATLNLIVAQRLVRRLCDNCKAPASITAQMAEKIRQYSDMSLAGATVFQATGCDQCQQKGFRGRVAVAELLRVDENIRRQIATSANTQSIRDSAAASGMQSLVANGIVKVLHGVTTFEEVFRVTRDDN